MIIIFAILISASTGYDAFCKPHMEASVHNYVTEFARAVNCDSVDGNTTEWYVSCSSTFPRQKTFLRSFMRFLLRHQRDLYRQNVSEEFIKQIDDLRYSIYHSSDKIAPYCRYIEWSAKTMISIATEGKLEFLIEKTEKEEVERSIKRKRCYKVDELALIYHKHYNCSLFQPKLTWMIACQRFFSDYDLGEIYLDMLLVHEHRNERSNEWFWQVAGALSIDERMSLFCEHVEKAASIINEMV